MPELIFTILSSSLSSCLWKARRLKFLSPYKTQKTKNINFISKSNDLKKKMLVHFGQQWLTARHENFCIYSISQGWNRWKSFSNTRFFCFFFTWLVTEYLLPTICAVQNATLCSYILEDVFLNRSTLTQEWKQIYEFIIFGTRNLSGRGWFLTDWKRLFL